MIQSQLFCLTKCRKNVCVFILIENGVALWFVYSVDVILSTCIAFFLCILQSREVINFAVCIVLQQLA